MTKSWIDTHWQVANGCMVYLKNIVPFATRVIGAGTIFSVISDLNDFPKNVVDIYVPPEPESRVVVLWNGQRWFAFASDIEAYCIQLP